MRKLIIVGSSKRDGNTVQLVKELSSKSGWDYINLLDYNINHFDYNYDNINDDFLPLIERIITKYDMIIFATPVYWYSMSGIMKVFFDRLTDLLTIRKELGRKLRGKSAAAISSSIGNHLGEQFWLPIQHTVNYLGITYVSHIHILEDENHEDKLSNFIKLINNIQ